jgi:cobalamin biosynthetic protein CobC
MSGEGKLRHGGDLSEATTRYGEPPGGWLDLSTGINPRPYPVRRATFADSELSRLPSRQRLEELLAAARRAYGVAQDVAIAAVPGAEIAIRCLPRILQGPVRLVDTSYASYRDAFAGAAEFEVVGGIEGDVGASLIVVNPNNPDGRRFDADAVLALARCTSGAPFVVVDESYADAEPEGSVVLRLRPDDRVLVLKSFGKFFGLPGLRLGFAIGGEASVRALQALLGDWPVSVPAISIGRAALADEEWQAGARSWLARQACALESVLHVAGLTRAGGCALFRAATARRAADVHARLARQGIWTRTFEERPGLLRFGLPPDDVGLERLAKALSAA